MEEKEIQNQINDAVRIFKETLEASYLKPKRAFYGIGVHGTIEQALCGTINVQRLNNKNLKISGELQQDCFNEKCNGLPMKPEDWDIRPIVITLFNKDFNSKLNSQSKPKGNK